VTLMLKRFFIHATNLHQGGGKALLIAIINALPNNVEIFINLDTRMEVAGQIPNNIHLKYFKPSVFDRFKSELWLLRHVKHNDVTLCFGNLPPIFKLLGSVNVFLQNRYLVDNVSLSQFKAKTRLRLLIERFWFVLFMGNVDSFIVQTPSMQKLLVSRVKDKTPIRILPFVAKPNNYLRKNLNSETKAKSTSNFIYVASGEPHKNHKRLVAAWCLLAEENLFPSLRLTIDQLSFNDLCNWIDDQVTHCKLNITNEGSLSHDDVIRLYGSSSAMIYPSTFESFGIPLIEARQAGLSILASELDYVRDVIDAEETFDPNSAVSIARAVKRFLMKEEVPLSLLDAESFIEQVLNEGV
jgi:glycosyltransferase involved in cell wall biosynthesis